MRRGFELGLYLVTDRVLCGDRGVPFVVAEAVAGGVSMVQLRDDTTPSGELIVLAQVLVGQLAPQRVPLIVNNRLDVALASGAAGLHVGQTDLAPAAARAALGPTAILGLSITATAQMTAVDPALVDYLGVGPIFATATKLDAAPAMGLVGLAACRARSRLPIVAIGGIDATNAAAVMRAGADGVAVVSAVCAATSPRAAAAELDRRIGRANREEAP